MSYLEYDEDLVKDFQEELVTGMVWANNANDKDERSIEE